MTATSPVVAAADRIEKAASGREPCAPVRDLLGREDVGAAYAVQQLLTDRRLEAGATIVGRKIGLTAPAVQQQLGVDQPDFGVLFDDMDLSANADHIPAASLLQPKVEAEIAFILGTDLDDDLTPERVRAAIAYAVPALEIVDSRIEGWDITITDTVADNASSGLFVLGENRVTLDRFEPAAAAMRMYAGDALASEGTGAACLGDPLNALLWLARTAHAFGRPLSAGQIVLSGALGPMVTVTPGLSVRAEISGLGTVRATFTDKDPS
jgi:2-keto-4-pentenoate hydratase